MKTHKLSRRRLLGGLLSALIAWLCPRPPQAAAAPRRAAPPRALRPSRSLHTCTYAYDSMGRLVSVTEHPPQPSEPIHRTHPTREHGTYTYDLA